MNKEKRIQQQKEILKILEKENVFIPLYSPYYSNLITKDIE
jgi:ABC-type transport system substrate-binding protein